MATRVKNWEQFQHFKDRSPPWIKLYRTILDDPEWHKLDPSAAKMLVMLWLLASENHGELPPLATAAFRLRKSEGEVEQAAIKLSHWLEHEDISLISTRYQCDTVAVPKNSVADVSVHQERETEEEREKETEKKPRSPSGSRLPDDWQIPEEWQAWAEKERPDLHVANVASQFKDFWIAKPGKDGRKLDWAATWRNWIRNTKAAQQGFRTATDVARLTVPSTPGRDPALLKLEEDDRRAAPPSLETLARLAELRRPKC